MAETKSKRMKSIGHKPITLKPSLKKEKETIKSHSSSKGKRITKSPSPLPSSKSQGFFFPELLEYHGFKKLVEMKGTYYPGFVRFIYTTTNIDGDTGYLCAKVVGLSSEGTMVNDRGMKDVGVTFNKITKYKNLMKDPSTYTAIMSKGKGKERFGICLLFLEHRLLACVLTWIITPMETFSFHLPVREMTITLDDVSCLLHFPVTSRPIDHIPSLFDREVVKILRMTHLSIPIETKASAVANTCVRVRLTFHIPMSFCRRRDNHHMVLYVYRSSEYSPGKKLIQEKVWKPTKQNEVTQNEEKPMNVVIKSAEQQEEPQKKQEEPQKKQEEPQREQDEPHKETQNEWTIVTSGKVDRGKRAMIHTPKSSFGPYQNSIIFTPLRIGDCPKGNNTT
ncbi:hypothetical protein JHK86_034984 [Glycine max]|nr:hypothetical protein JHK86_034984 [Glycine max]